MGNITNLFKGGRKKALTLSYDDGVTQDKRLVSIFNKYALKATFNLNSGIQSENNYWINKGKTIRRMNIEGIEDVYKGHEIAIHSVSHPHLEDLPKEMLITEIFDDRKNLEKIFGYTVRGMAYPYGTYNEKVLRVMDNCGIEYSRTVNQHEKFNLPENFLEWHPTCHHNDKLIELGQKFVDFEYKGKLKLMYVWGHSFEFHRENNWKLIEDFCKLVSGKEDIWYTTNVEIMRYVKALKTLEFSAAGDMVYNPTAISVWINVNDKAVEVKSSQIVKL